MNTNLGPQIKPPYRLLTCFRDQRRGAAALVCAMTAAVVFLGVSGAAVQTILRARQERKTERDLHQLSFLLDAGVLRAQEQLKMAPNYLGETWLDEDSPYDTAKWQVTIVTQPVRSEENISSDIDIQVTARINQRHYSPETIQRTRKLSVRRP